jgi:hypothetical protein
MKFIPKKQTGGLVQRYLQANQYSLIPPIKKQMPIVPALTNTPQVISGKGAATMINLGANPISNGFVGPISPNLSPYESSKKILQTAATVPQITMARPILNTLPPVTSRELAAAKPKPKVISKPVSKSNPKTATNPAKKQVVKRADAQIYSHNPNLDTNYGNSLKANKSAKPTTTKKVVQPAQPVNTKLVGIGKNQKSVNAGGASSSKSTASKTAPKTKQALYPKSAIQLASEAFTPNPKSAIEYIKDAYNPISNAVQKAKNNPNDR